MCPKCPDCHHNWRERSEMDLDRSMALSGDPERKSPTVTPSLPFITGPPLHCRNIVQLETIKSRWLAHSFVFALKKLKSGISRRRKHFSRMWNDFESTCNCLYQIGSHSFSHHKLTTLRLITHSKFIQRSWIFCLCLFLFLFGETKNGFFFFCAAGFFSCN